ncbi:GGDEF domain-containing protein [Schnuerera sp.]|uniref:GGDEF domain-containing protein n=1 Tax=Schnuerera sp. TaxID=2794844 RepID=UPI002B711657|nr:GGDEF domain-containing protein [Schnuerera sp.]HSH36609.1 GGDEF domain-containing protein [Schnuerera sp.]
MGKGKFNKRDILLTFMLIVVIFLLYLLNTPINSKDNHKYSETIVFLGNKNIAPIIYEESGVAKGVAVDIAKELGKKIGYKIEVKAIDWEEAQQKVLLGEADALLQINMNSERKKVYDFSDELLESEFLIFVKSGNNGIETVNDLKNKIVGVEYGGYPYNLLQKYDGIKINTISDWKIGFEMVKSGELDAIVMDKWIGEYELARSKVRGIQIIEEPIETKYSRIAVKKGNGELLNLINAGLKEMKEDGTMTDILGDWQGKKVIYLTEESIRSTLLYTTIVILILVLIVTIYLVNKFSKLNKKLELDVMERTQELYETNELLRKANAELERISMVDGLTNISNRRYFDIVLQKAWRIGMRERQPLALIMIDIDNFKMFNDTYGHLAGDQCLKIVADVIKKVAKRSGDFVARFGGEEFVAFLYNTTEDGASIVAEEIRAKIENLGIKQENMETVVTVSLGVAAMIPNKNIHSNNLINAADQALYQAKKDGRNTVVRSSSLLNRE